MTHLVSIICPTYNEEKFITSCLNSMLEQNFPKENLEILVVDGRSTDRTREIVAQYTAQYSFIHLLDNPYKVVPHALNIGIRNSIGNVIIRIDAHCSYPHYYISTLIKYLFELNADNVGGVWNTIPAKNTSRCRAIAIASSHKFGVGGSMHKVGSKNITQTDTVPFGCYRRDVFDRIGYFDEELTRNQDDEFNARLINHGGKIFLIPDLVIEYVARDSLRKMSSMYYQYGLFKPLVNKKLGKPATIRQFFPALFLCGLVIGAILSCYSKIIMLFYLSVCAIYWIIGFIIGMKKAMFYKDIKIGYYLPITFFIIHISYGWGYITGIYKIITKTKFQAQVNR
jgi:glycosyltransferase involved in cell wall biosynthesis